MRWRQGIALLRPHAKWGAIGLAAVIGQGLANLLQPWPLKVVLDHVNQTRSVHGWTARLAGEGMTESAALLAAGVALVTVALLGALCSYIVKYATTHVGQWLAHDLRTRLYGHILSLPLSYHTGRQTGDLITRLTGDIDSVQTFLASSLLDAVVDTITLAGIAGIMFFLNWRFTLIALSVAPILFAVSYYYTRRSKKVSREVRKQEGEIVSLLEEVLSSAGVVKAFAREEYELGRLEEKNARSVSTALRARSIKARISPVVETVAAIGTALVIWYGGDLVVSGGLSGGSLAVLVWYVGKMYKPLQDFARLSDAYAKAAVGYERLREVFDTQPSVPDLPGARKLPPVKGEIEFQNVSFSYAPGRPVLKNIKLRLPAGQVTALVGPTGSGKSTIAALIGRLYDPDSGAVRVDGIDLRQIRQKEWRNQISFVLQESVLFHAPIWQNIAYGNPGAGEAEIRRAAELANVHEFVSLLPDGYETVIGERGVTLSGGQRQRIAIARAIIRDTPILVLDEPTASLDAASEAQVFEAIERLIEGKTAIVIAHRLSTVRRAGAIVVIEDGSIAEIGTHDQLLRAGGVYAKLYNLQFRRDEPQEAPSRIALAAG